MSKIITIAELQSLNVDALGALYRQAQSELAHTHHGTPERREALASLENILRVMNERRQVIRPPGL